MKGCAIVYKTRLGSSEKYSKWLSKSLKCKYFEAGNFKDFGKYDNFIFIGGTYGGRIPISDFIKANKKELEDKKIILVALGAVDKDNWWSRITYFFLPKFIKKNAKYFKIYGKPGKGKEPIKKSNLKEVIEYAKKVY